MIIKLGTKKTSSIKIDPSNYYLVVVIILKAKCKNYPL